MISTVIELDEEYTYYIKQYEQAVETLNNNGRRTKDVIIAEIIQEETKSKAEYNIPGFKIKSFIRLKNTRFLLLEKYLTLIKQNSSKIDLTINRYNIETILNSN